MRTPCIALPMLLALVLATACASPAPPPPQLPAFAEGQAGEYDPGRFVWVDLLTQDVAVAERFYGELFGWTFHNRGGRYTEIRHDGRAIAGMVPARDPEQGSEWVGNLSVADVDEATTIVVGNGGVVEQGPIEAPDRGRMALVTDDEAAMLLLVRAGAGDPPLRTPTLDEWFWRELWTHDIPEAVDFYSELADYEVQEVDLDGLPYHVLMIDDAPRAGIVEAPEEVHPLWLPYVRVDDTKRVADAAAALGARVVMQHEQSAILVDPTGAPFAVQVWEPRTRDGEER